MKPEERPKGFFARHRRMFYAASMTVGLVVGAAGLLVSLPWLQRGQPNYARVRVYYGTDRARTGSDRPSEFYGSARGAMDYGFCEVSIPRDHRMGDLEKPSILRLEFRRDPEKHVVLLDAVRLEREAFFRELRGEAASAVSEALVFIHGFNVSFDDAARRTAQMKYDLGFRGPALFFSWPSKADVSAYPADEATIEWATPDLLGFLSDVALEADLETVHVIAHSMGNRGAVRALGELAASDDAGLRGRFREIVLTAPDIDRDVFIRDIAPRLSGLGARVTLYASSRDKALMASKKFHQAPRAGELSGGPLIVPGIDSIDASRVDTSMLGHSYYAENVSVMADLFYVITPRPPIGPADRFALKPVNTAQGTYWEIRE